MSTERLIADAARFANVEVAGEVFLLDHETGTSFRIGGSGARFWSLLLDGTTTGDAAATVADETHAPIARVRADLEAFVGRLLEIGAVQAAPSEGPSGTASG